LHKAQNCAIIYHIFHKTHFAKGVQYVQNYLYEGASADTGAVRSRNGRCGRGAGAAANERGADRPYQNDGGLFRVSLLGSLPMDHWVRNFLPSGGAPQGQTGENANETARISREAAEEKLRAEIASIESRLDGFLSKNDVELTDNQYDALVSFTFNVGFNWTTGCKLQRYLAGGIENYSTNEIASAFGIWCHAGDDLEIDKILVARRIREIKIFLYGDYIGDASADFIYLIFDGSGGSVDMDIMLYEAGQPYGAFTSA